MHYGVHQYLTTRVHLHIASESYEQTQVDTAQACMYMHAANKHVS